MGQSVFSRPAAGADAAGQPDPLNSPGGPIRPAGRIASGHPGWKSPACVLCEAAAAAAAGTSGEEQPWARGFASRAPSRTKIRQVSHSARK